jgi:hypothetical protein
MQELLENEGIIVTDNQVKKFKELFWQDWNEKQW